MPLSRISIFDRFHSCFGTRRLPLLGCALLLSGCTSMGQTPRTAWHTLDPEAPLGAQDQVRTRRFPEVTTGPAVPLTPDSGPLSPIEPPPGRRETARTQPDPTRIPIPKIPRIEFDDAVPGSGLELSVDAPARKQVGSHATYRVTVRNSSEQPVNNVTVQCRFDEPLVFSGTDKRSVVQRLESLQPGESKELTLSLYSARVGSHCCRFGVTTGTESSSSEAANKSVCVEFVSRQLQIDMVGPTQRTEGSRAEFTFTLTNHSTRTLSEVKAALTYDKALVPREASAGKEAKPGSLSWNLGTLQPLESIQLQVDFECLAVARRACVALEVLAEQISSEHDEACLEIIPVPGTLDLRISDRDDPLEVGKTGQYELTIHNIGLQPARKLALEATVPEQLKIVSIKVLNGTDELRVASRQEQGRLIFDPVEDLAADDRLTILIDVEAVAAGTAYFRVRLGSSLGSTPITTAEPTVVAEP